MRWIGRAFGRALIYNGVRETFRAGRQAQRKSTSRRQHVAKFEPGMDIAIRYTCLRCGHEFHQHFNRVVDEQDTYAPCPSYGKKAIWRCIDIHEDNLAVP